MLAAVTLICVAMLGAVAVLCAFAPVGYEDADGFHYGRSDDDLLS